MLVLVLSSTFAAVSDWPQLRPPPPHSTAESEDQLMLGRHRPPPAQSRAGAGGDNILRSEVKLQSASMSARDQGTARQLIMISNITISSGTDGGHHHHHLDI